MSVQKRVSGAGQVSWYVRWYESGRGSARRQRVFDTKRDAQLFEAELRRTAQMGAHTPGEASSEPLADWLRTWTLTNRDIWAPSTHINRASNLSR